MKAGFGCANINPPKGTPLFGFGGRDRDPQGCSGINDDLMVRALYLEQPSSRCLILAFDLLFFSRAEADRLKGMLCRRFDLKAKEVVLNCSHTHAGPRVGDWGIGLPDALYMEDLHAWVAAAAQQAMDCSQPVRLSAGRGTSRLPVSRRYINEKGIAAWRPSEKGEIYPHLPFCRFDTPDGEPVSLLFSVACHPSTIGGLAASADYPGEACRRLDAALGRPAAIFLQGCGGDTKACVIADAIDDDNLIAWRPGTPEDVREAGRIVAEEVLRAMQTVKTVRELPEGIVCHIDELKHPLQPPPDREFYEKTAKEDPHSVKRFKAEQQLERLDSGRDLVSSAPILCQTVKIAEGLRLVALEGEPVAGYGHLIDAIYPDEIVFPLGYSNGQGLYIPTDRMYPEEGYEVVSAYEYGFPGPAAPGFEERLRTLLNTYRSE